VATAQEVLPCQSQLWLLHKYSPDQLIFCSPMLQPRFVKS